MPGIFTIGVVPRSDRYDAEDDRWRDQVADLSHDLRVQTESLQIRRSAVPGTKGTIDELVLALGSAGVFTAAVDVLRAWLSRDRTRSVDLTYVDDEGRSQHLSVTAANADGEALAPVIAAVAARIQAAR